MQKCTDAEIVFKTYLIPIFEAYLEKTCVNYKEWENESFFKNNYTYQEFLDSLVTFNLLLQSNGNEVENWMRYESCQADFKISILSGNAILSVPDYYRKFDSENHIDAMLERIEELEGRGHE